jgi:ABC-type Zn uptake system ZnuABC Zn-binding protein ZnuA
MNRNQKLLLFSIALIGILSFAGGSALFSVNTPSDKITVVATYYPLAYLTQEIGGNHVNVVQLVPNNVDYHSWEPLPSTIIAAENADLIVYNGAGLDHWMEDNILPALSSSKVRRVIDTTDGLALLTDYSHQEDHNHKESSEHNDHHHGPEDPHTYVSPYMAKLQAQKIYDALIQIDPDNQSYYHENWVNLKDKLQQLDSSYLEELSMKQKDEIFVSHEAFGYLADRYGFEQHGVIGISTDQQPSAAAVKNLVDLMIEHESFVVFVDPVFPTEYAQTLKYEVEVRTGSSVEILKLYLITGEIDGLNLLQQMESNLANLKVGLGISSSIEE